MIFRRFSLLLLICFVFFHSRSQTQLPESFFLADSLRTIVQTLASDSFQGRLSGTAGCSNAANFIAEQFRNAGLKPVRGGDDFFWQVNNLGSNVIGAIEGKSKKEEIIIFSAHYDHIGTIKTNPTTWKAEQTKTRKKDFIYNGANDDASGVAAVISLAKYFAAHHNNERTILFVAFTGEELGLLGSQSFASIVTHDLVKAVINIEMIGRKRGNDDNPYITGPDQSNLLLLLNNRLRNSDPLTYNKPYFIQDYFGSENLFERSDNFPFVKYGIPAHSIMLTSPTDKYYHSLSDEASTLDYHAMSNIIKAIAIASAGLVTGEDTPSRIGNYEQDN